MSRVINTIEKLRTAVDRGGAPLSVGLEPSPSYLPAGYEPTISGPRGFEAFLGLVVSSSSPFAAAFKVNLAFFEALGPEGWSLLYRVREAVARHAPHAVFIADGKRGDIGSTAGHAARAIFDADRLDADAATVNPLMGADAVAPFLEHEGKLTYLLALTSNPGAADFLMQAGGDGPTLAERIAGAARSYGAGAAGSVGLVVGATREADASSVRRAGGDLPWLVPGVGSQGGSAEDIARAAAVPGDAASLLFHVTRGVLPAATEAGDVGAAIADRARAYRDRIASALGPAPQPDDSGSEHAQRDRVGEVTRRTLERVGALRSGHFVLSSGLHSDRYCQCARLFEHPEEAAGAARSARSALVAAIGGAPPTAVVAPALGGVLWGYEVARALGPGVRSLFAERHGEADAEGVKAFALRRGFALGPADRVVLAEDVVTTGGSVMSLVPLVESSGAEVAAIVSVVDRSGGGFAPRDGSGRAIPFVALASLEFATFEPGDVPEWLAATPVESPGSKRSGAGAAGASAGGSRA